MANRAEAPENVQSVKLIFVSADNHNKFYNMTKNSDGTFTAKWGRVGVTETTTVYPMARWGSQYRDKIKKGYRDQTHLFITSQEKVDFTEISDDVINKLVRELQAFANRSVATNYTVSSDAVTELQINAAQEIIDQLAAMVVLRAGTSKINQMLIDLFQVIPRKMAHVNDHLMEFGTISDKDKLNYAQKMISDEQDLLDVMRGQVQVSSAQKVNTQEKKQTLLAAVGIEIIPTVPSDIITIKKLMGQIKDRYRISYQVVNKKTQKLFDDHVAQAKNKKTELLWHGSRNENWWSILQAGLLIRPSNAIYTGSMFSDGIYTATEADKSLGYTSITGSRWSNGSSNKAFLALYNVHVGNPWYIHKHENWCYSIKQHMLDQKGFDCVWAKKGPSLYRDEIIVYQPQRLTVKYLVEIK